ncbi:hypothetical protein EDB82DRAFT_492082 [Fusarium venenatum]|uniref:uncharacterized protein n=1 Tax=Fusarium venenatum TaxID=56646 RepID=UPI001D3F5820|nr:hypothetical protein EDB82DRAFT_492082 [Fusarium venenatum]
MFSRTTIAILQLLLFALFAYVPDSRMIGVQRHESATDSQLGWYEGTACRVNLHLNCQETLVKGPLLVHLY